MRTAAYCSPLKPTRCFCSTVALRGEKGPSAALSFTVFILFHVWWLQTDRRDAKSLGLLATWTGEIHDALSGLLSKARVPVQTYIWAESIALWLKENWWLFLGLYLLGWPLFLWVMITFCALTSADVAAPLQQSQSQRREAVSETCLKETLISGLSLDFCKLVCYLLSYKGWGVYIQM